MKSTRVAAFLAMCSVVVMSIASAAEPAPAEITGVAVGKAAPDFTLKDQSDREVSLAGLLKKGPVAVVFFRSADW